MSLNNKPTTLETWIFLLTGLALFLGGIYLTHHFLVTINSGIAYIFIIFLPAPMILFGLIAVIRAWRGDDKEVKNITIFEVGVPSKIVVQSDGNNGNALDQRTGVSSDKKVVVKNPSLSSVLILLFMIFGVFVMLAITIGSLMIDINRGFTHVCPRRASSCYDVFLKTSPNRFYLQLILNTALTLTLTIILGMFIKKQIDKQSPTE